MSNRCRVISDQRRNLIWSWSLRRSLSSCAMLFHLTVNLLATTSEQNSSVQNGQSAIQDLYQHRPNRFLLYRFQSSQNLLVTVFDLGLGEIWEGGQALIRLTHQDSALYRLEDNFWKSGCRLGKSCANHYWQEPCFLMSWYHTLKCDK